MTTTIHTAVPRSTTDAPTQPDQAPVIPSAPPSTNPFQFPDPSTAPAEPCRRDDDDRFGTCRRSDGFEELRLPSTAPLGSKA